VSEIALGSWPTADDCRHQRTLSGAGTRLAGETAHSARGWRDSMTRLT
jgi:hypothetical protein